MPVQPSTFGPIEARAPRLDGKRENSRLARTGSTDRFNREEGVPVVGQGRVHLADQAGAARPNIGWALLSIVVVALLLRLANLGGKSLWIDEGFSVHESRLPASAIWAGTDEPNHPPLYYLLLHYWPFIRTEFSLRLPSALASTGAVVVLYLIARRLFDQRLALTSAAILAVSPLDIWYAQEARMFALATLAVLLAVMGLIEESPRGAVLMAIGLTVGIYTYFAVVPLWLCLSAAWLAWRWKTPRGQYSMVLWLVASAIASLALLPLWPKLVGFVEDVGAVFGIERFLKLVGLPPPPGWINAMLLAALMAGVFIATILARRLHKDRLSCWFAALMLTAFVLATILMPIPRLYSLKRLVVIGWPFVALAVSWLLMRRAWRIPLSAILTISLAAAAASILLVEKSDFRSAVAYLNSRVRVGDQVWMTGKSELYTYNYYDPRSPGHWGELDAIEASLPPSSRVWFIVDCPRCGVTPHQRWLDRTRDLATTDSFYGLDLRLYQPAR